MPAWRPRVDPFVLAAPGAGERISVPVAPGQPVALPDQIFDPGSSRYVIDGDDLVVMPAGGGRGRVRPVLRPSRRSADAVRAGRAAGQRQRADGPRRAGWPPAAAWWWWRRSPCPTRPTPAPAPAAAASAGGGAGFAPYDPGDLGPGLAPTGPLGPTALAYGAEFPQLDGAFGDRGGDDRAAAPPPGPGAPLQPPGLPEPRHRPRTAPAPRADPVPPIGPTISVAGAALGVIAESAPRLRLRLHGRRSGAGESERHCRRRGSTGSTPPTSPSTRPGRSASAS